ncbi:hypothetical protein [Candidatus Nitrosocosmicus sp. SS]|jgi:hypothetical protein|uniref:hypothetical protein n=1 Tax=Candidatus Nitrosocosmicus agrestis TaxID=2563600 RepID=UPI00122E5D7E|nr:hypothetical protein [Candidatus Nitrosocosmicus sp. SS]KAA2280374.1 hypothetical protein F1Z66_11305 [Candidatus Nitrosocosmicus sp. SS]KAF0868050.1 hypothetical protein E5N71_12305 [Candidatus Nitrosocosmicus sp. SS]
MIALNIKQKVIEEWLGGLSRRIIAKNNDISEGSVSSITAQFEREYGIVNNAREIARFLYKNGIDYLQFGRAIRFHHNLDSCGVSYEKAGETLFRLQEHCFRNNIDLDTFLSHFNTVIDRLDGISIPIEKFDEIIEEKSKTIDKQNCMIEKNRIFLEEQNKRIIEVEKLKPLLPIHAKYLESVESGKIKDETIKTLRIIIKLLLKQIELLKGNKENEEKL